MKAIRARYQAICRPDEADALARAIAWEQTVEVVEAAVPWPDVRERMVGRVESVSHDGECADILIHYNPELAVNQITPLFNLAYGNVSLYPQVRLTSLSIPDELADAIGGPQFGIEGIRQQSGVYDRPLLCTAIKPRGASIEHLADIAYRYALGGGDLIKDDQNLAEIELHEFQHRVLAIHQALERAADKTGRRCLYFPHVTGAGPQLAAQMDFIAGLRISGALFCPLALGLALCKQMARDYGLIAMYHPAFAGTFTVPQHHGIAADVIYGLLYRLAGADVSIFPGPGGRVSLSEEENHAIADQLRHPLGQLKSTLPCPAGGKTLDLLPDLMQVHGADSLLLAGGALLTNDPDLSVGTRRFLDKIKETYPGQERLQIRAQRPDRSYVLRHEGPGQWSQRQFTDYKTDSNTDNSQVDFQSVSRLPLVGSAQESTQFQFRYFELAPDGHTSFEHHVHSHTVMVHRGQCTLVMGEGKERRTHLLEENDIAYIDTLVPHQLRNHGSTACGFFCIVDRWRDRPVGQEPVSQES